MISSRSPRSRSTGALLLAGLAGLSTIASACGTDASATTTDDQSPLEALFGWGDYDEVESRRQELELQQQLVVCMKGEGFEYIAVDWSSQGPQQVEDEDSDLEWDSDEFGEKYGYGVMRSYETWEAAEIEANISGTSVDEEYFDPNQDYVMALSESEQTAYYETLYGKQDEQYDEDGEWIQPPLELQGCQGSAQKAVYGEDIWSTPGFSDAFEEASKRLESNPRMLNANADWKVCMADAIAEVDAEGGLVEGMSIDGPNDIYQSMDTIKAIAIGQEVLPLDPATGEPVGDFDDTGGWSSYTDEDGTGFAMVGERSLISGERIDEIQAFEVATWKQDRQCQKDAGIEAISDELEQQLADDLVAQFPQLTDKSAADSTTTDSTDSTEDGA